VRDVLDKLVAWQAEGVEVGRAVVIRTYGSAPRQPGSVMLYSSDGRIAGSVSGGCVESAAAQEIAAARESGVSRVVRYGISEEQAWDVGLACGGTIEVLIEPAVPLEVIDAALNPGTIVATELPTEDARADPSRRFIYRANDGTDSELTAAANDALLRGTSRVAHVAGRDYFLEVFPVKPRLVIFGAVEIARPLVKLARELGYTTVVVDARATFATRERFPEADELVVGWPDEAAYEIGLGPDDSVAVLSHDMKLDEPAIREGLGRQCRYVGAIGSTKTQADRRQSLLDADVAQADVARLRGPIGLDLGGRSPAETALAIMAEVVAARYGATGGSLTR